jgi:hypothetical protein
VGPCLDAARPAAPTAGDVLVRAPGRLERPATPRRDVVRLAVLRGEDDYIAGHGRMRIGRQRVSGPEIDQGENLFLWAELLLIPSVLATRPGVRWEPVDTDTDTDTDSARLRVPFGTGEDELLVRFDPDTGLISECRAMRFRTPGQPKVGWHIWYERWTHFAAGRYPTRISVRWADQPRPWFVLDVDGVAVNGPVDIDLSASPQPVG